MPARHVHAVRGPPRPHRLPAHHARRRAPGTSWWALLNLTPGPWQVVVELQPTALGRAITLGVDLTVRGDYRPEPLPPTADDRDGERRSRSAVRRADHPGRAAQIAVTVTDARRAGHRPPAAARRARARRDHPARAILALAHRHAASRRRQRTAAGVRRRRAGARDVRGLRRVLPRRPAARRRVHRRGAAMTETLDQARGRPPWTRNRSGPQSVQLDVQGMTCASCAARIEKKLNRLEGVNATVNYATEKATVQFGGATTPADADRDHRADRVRREPAERRRARPGPRRPRAAAGGPSWPRCSACR